MSTRESIQAALEEAATCLELFRANPVQLENLEAFVAATIQTLAIHRTLFSCGNGGSMSQARHCTLHTPIEAVECELLPKDLSRAR